MQTRPPPRAWRRPSHLFITRPGHSLLFRRVRLFHVRAVEQEVGADVEEVGEKDDVLYRWQFAACLVLADGALIDADAHLYARSASNDAFPGCASGSRRVRRRKGTVLPHPCGRANDLRWSLSIQRWRGVGASSTAFAKLMRRDARLRRTCLFRQGCLVSTPFFVAAHEGCPCPHL